MNLPGAERHVDDDDLEPADGRCPLCGSNDQRTRLFAIQSEPDVNWLRCPTCHGSSASRMPTTDYLRRYYRTYYDDRAEKVTVGRPQRLADHIAGLLPPRRGDGSISIIDYGGGDGTVARLLARRLRYGAPGTRANIRIVDEHAPDETSNDGISCVGVDSLEQLGDADADVILASAVLEHIPDCDTVMADLFGRLRPSGRLYARTPFRAPIKRFAPWVSMQFPMHVHDLGPSFWNRVADRHPDVDVVVSQPSLVAAPLSGRSFPQALVAHAMKLPARLECRIRRGPTDYVWKPVGGWEVVIRDRRPS